MDEMERDQKSFRSLGDVPKVVYLSTQKGDLIMTHKTSLFPAWMTTPPDLSKHDRCKQTERVDKKRVLGKAV